MLPNQRVATVAQDSFYRNLTPEEIALAADHNFDEPAAFDWPLMYDVLYNLRMRKKVEIPSYDYTRHARGEAKTTLWNIDVVLFEGILAFHDEPEHKMSELMDLRIFVETDSDTRLARRVFRDTQTRGRTLESVLAQYERFVKPAFEQHIMPLKKKADVIIPWGDYSQGRFSDDGSWQRQRYPALDMIVEHIRLLLSLLPPFLPSHPFSSCRNKACGLCTTCTLRLACEPPCARVSHLTPAPLPEQKAPNQQQKGRERGDGGGAVMEGQNKAEQPITGHTATGTAGAG